MRSKRPRWWMVVTIAIFMVGLLLAFVEYSLGWTWNWTGFNKPLWDWMQLLIIPIALAVIAVWFNRVERKKEQAIATDNQQEAALQAYLDKMSELLLHGKLRESQSNDEVRNVARARTLTVLPRLDEERKGNLIRFVYESRLTEIISLRGADLKGANLSRAHLEGTNLSEAHLEGANLSEAILLGANLSKAHLDGANLSKASLEGANLSGACLKDATLKDATLKDALLGGADLEGADLRFARIAEAHLEGANLKDANLNWTVLDKTRSRQ